MNQKKHGDFFYYENSLVIGALFELSFKDFELENFTEAQRKLSLFFENSPEGFSYRFIAQKDLETRKDLFSYRENLNEVHSVKTQRLFVSIEKDLKASDVLRKTFLKTNSSQAEKFFKNLNTVFFESDFGLKNVSIKELSPELVDIKLTRAKNGEFLESGPNKIGIIKLVNLSQGEILEEELCHIWDLLPEGARVVTKIKPKNKLQSKKLLGSIKRKKKGVESLSSYMDEMDAESLESRVDREGSKICELQMSIVLFKDVSKKSMAYLLESITQEISSFGEFKIDYYGAYASYEGLKVLGVDSWHLLESTEKIFPYIPFLTKGEKAPYHLEPTKKDLVLKRQNNTLTTINPLNPKYTAYNNLIIGRTGRGKSVLFGMILDMLLKSKNNMVQILDIGGSYTNLVKNLNGVERSFSLSHPSGINPFKYVNHPEIGTPEKAEILASFVESLCLEEGERTLKKSERAGIETSLLDFIEEKKDSKLEPTIIDFLNEKKDTLPRYDVLKRFGEKGIYKNVFMPNLAENRENQKAALEYFNFQTLMKSSDKSFVNAGVSAVISSFNLNIFTEKEKKKILTVDECPEFIESNYEFFKFSSSNIRKFGGCMFVLAQTLEKICPNGDLSFVSQFDNKYLFTVDPQKEVFKEALNITENAYETIQGFKTVKGVGGHSLCLYKDIFGERVIKTEIRPSEYWNLTTSSEDKAKIEEALSFLPSFNREEVISLLAQIDVLEGGYV